MRGAMSTAGGDKILCMYSDSEWCVDIFDRRQWMTQGKKLVRHHDIWHEVLSIVRSGSAPVSVTHVYGHK